MSVPHLYMYTHNIVIYVGNNISYMYILQEGSLFVYGSYKLWSQQLITPTFVLATNLIRYCIICQTLSLNVENV